MTAGLILAGGKSQRMGQDKAFMSLAGRTLIQRVVDALAPLCDELIIATNTPDAYAHLRLRMVTDVFAQAGSLGGLHAALSAATQDPAVAVACDMPFLNVDLLRHLVDLSTHADAVVPDLSERATSTGFAEGSRPKAKNLNLHPLHAVYRRTCLAAIQAQLRVGDLRMIGFLDKVRTQFVPRDEVLRLDPDLHSFLNVNTPEEWAQAEQIAHNARSDTNDGQRA